MDVLLIANPNSTTQHDGLFRRIIPTLRGVEGLRLTTRFTHRPGHAEELVAQLTRSEYDAVIAVGGDGTVNEVINGLLGPVREARDPGEVPALAVIPTGSANVFARALGFPADPIAAAEGLAESLQLHAVRTIALGTWGEDRWFAVNAGFGIDADVIEGVERVRHRGAAATPLRYLRVAVRAWQRIHASPPSIDAQGECGNGAEFSQRGLPLVVASNTNPWTFLGPMPVVTNPHNSFDKGIGLFCVEDIRGLGGVAAMAHLIGFGHSKALTRWFDRRTITIDDVASVQLTCSDDQRFQVDGEYVDRFRSVHLGAKENALEVYAPARPLSTTHRSRLRVLLSFFDVRI